MVTGAEQDPIRHNQNTFCSTLEKAHHRNYIKTYKKGILPNIYPNYCGLNGGLLFKHSFYEYDMLSIFSKLKILLFAEQHKNFCLGE